MKKDEIIKIALELFLKKGYEKTTITDIMKKTNLSKGGMYHYFSSKEDILDAVIKKAAQEEELSLREQARVSQTLEEKLALLLYPNILTSNYLMDFQLFTETHKKSLLYYKVREERRAYGTRYLTELIDQGIEQGEFTTDYPEEVSSLLFYYGDDLSFRGIDSKEREQFLTREFEFFLYVAVKLLNPSSSFVEAFSKYIEKIIKVRNLKEQ